MLMTNIEMVIRYTSSSFINVFSIIDWHPLLKTRMIQTEATACMNKNKNK